MSGRKASSAGTSAAGGNLKQAVPDVTRVTVRDTALAFAAPREGSVDAFTAVATVLAASVRQDAHPQDTLFLPDFAQSRNAGFAMKKDEPRMRAAIDRALLELKASGEALKIREAWFGPGAEQPMQRRFRITAEYSLRPAPRVGLSGAFGSGV
ncbi:MAG: transporter substrate-binding domain-containing protein [Burkholderiales bacterium]